MHPASDRDLEQRRDGQAADDAADDREAQLEPAAPRVEEGRALRRVVVEVEQAVPDPAADHRARDDPDGDEDQVVGPQRRAARHEPRDDERGDDDGGDRDRLPADDEATDEMEQGVEVERDEGGRHGVGSVSGARRRGGRRRLGGVGWPTPAVSPTGSSGGHGADIIGPWLAIARGRAAGLGGDTRRRILGGPPARARRPAHGGTGRASRASTDGMRMARRGAAPQALLQVDLLGRIEVRTAAGARVVLRRPSRPRPLRPAGPRPPPAVARGDRRRPLARIRRGLGRLAPPGPLARPARPLGRGLPPDSVLDVSTEAIAVRADANIALDIVAFEACLDASLCGAERAIALYGGDLVESLGHDCFAAERERLADRYEDALVTVAERRLAAGDLRGASEAAQRVIARDPLREEAHAILIAVHGLVGSRSQIVRQYRRLQVVLERELGEPPLPETDAAYRQAMRHAVQRSMERAARLEPDRRPALVAVAR